MKIETETRDDHQIRVIAELEGNVLDQYRAQAARKISRETKIPGFRPGKAPIGVIRRMVGDEALTQEAVELLVDAIYPEVLKEADLHPSYPGQLDEVVSLDPPKIAFIIPLIPEVTLGDYRAVRKDYNLEPVSEEEVDAFVNRLQASYSTAEPVERAAQEGDLVSLQITGTLTAPEEGEEAEFIKQTNFQALIGDTTFQRDNWPYPGFSKELMGLSAGDEKDITYVYPEDAELEKMRGREIVFHVAVQNIKQMTKPELDDEFAKTLGDFENMEALRKVIREQQEESKQQEYERDYYNELVDQIVEGATIKYPPQMLEEEEASVLRSIEQNLAQQRLDLETYLKMIEMDRADFIAKEVTPVAVRRLQRSLVLDQIARDEKIKLKEGDLETAFNQAFAELQNSTDLQKVRREMSDERLSEFLTYEAASRALNQRVMQRLKQIATGEEIVEEPETEETALEQEDAVELAEETAGTAEATEATEPAETAETAGTPASTEEQQDAEAPQA